ncbi:SCAN domain-containing protein 3-like [Amyelois transitella]|uniref:SCAN domain-containing protein 3-like n=1 Tax=Amyelois transitella TaxID=680683 RepID=UPI00298FA204|nr:SCAN domain-containing protein 3-like [Amyelois transitella]
MAARRGEPKKSDVPFDYQATKQEYMKTIKKQADVRPWLQSELKSVIADIKMANGKSSELTQTYETFVSDDQERGILILRRDKSPTIIEVVSAEDSFDLFVEVHQATGHGGRDKMLQNMRQKYHVSEVCLKIFLDLCNVCRTNKKVNPEKNIHHTVIVDLLDFCATPEETDGDFGHVLIYKFKWSGFTLLRPISSTNFEKDIALELLNIFLDFGPPAKIVVDISRLSLFQSVIVQIMSLSCDFSVLVEYNVNEDPTKYCIKDSIQNWIDVNGTGKGWATMCHLLQWKINKSKSIEQSIHVKDDCPHSAHFK